jgi:hypothetical protein
LNWALNVPVDETGEELVLEPLGSRDLKGIGATTLWQVKAAPSLIPMRPYNSCP